MPQSRSTPGQTRHSSALQNESHDMIHRLASSSDSNDEHILYHKYRSLPLLKRWLRKVLPVAELASYQQDIEIVIEGGDKVVSAIKHSLKERDIRGRQTIVHGYFCLKMKSLTHSMEAQSINTVWIRIATILGPRDTNRAMGLLDSFVNATGCGSRFLHDDIATRLVVEVNNYCSRQLGSQLKVPKRVIGIERSGLYQKTPDRSFEPGFLVRTSKSTDYFPTVVCEVGMSSAVSEVIFDCLSYLAGSRFLVDLAFGVDIVIEKSSLTKIRLFTFDASIQALATLAEESHGIARVTMSKIVNRLGHLPALRHRLQNLDSRDRCRFDDYLEFESSIEFTIQELEQLERTIGGSETEVIEDDIVETCRAVLHNSIVIDLDEDEGGNFKATRGGQPFDRLDVPVEPFLMLRLGPECRDHVTLSVEDMWRLFDKIKDAYRATNLENMESFIPLRLTKKDISGDYDEFVRLHENDEGFDIKAFERGDPRTAQKVSLRHLDDERVLRPLGQEYLAIIRGVENCSRALVVAAALHKLEELHGEGVQEYDLTSLPRQSRRNVQEYWNEFMDIYPDAPGHIQESFRRILNNEGIRNFLGIDENRRALIATIRRRGSLAAFLGDLGEDESKARNRLIDVVAGNSVN